MINLEHLLRTPHVEEDYGFDLSPDGTRAAFAWNKSGQWEIYEIPLEMDPKASPDPKLVTAGAGAKFAPKYSPNGKLLAYTVDFDGSENYHIYIYNFETHQHIDLTPKISHAIQPVVSWSPDGSRLALMADQSGNFDTYIMSIDDGVMHLAFANGHPCWTAKWSPDGRWIAIEVEMHAQDRGLFIVPADGSTTPRQVSADRKPLNATTPSWSPDGKKLAFASNARGYYDIAIYHIQSGEITWRTHGEAEDFSPNWSPDGRKMVYLNNRGARTWLEVASASETVRKFEVGQGVHIFPAITKDNQNVIFQFESPKQPGDLWRLSLKDGKFHQLTHSLPSELENAPFVMPREVRYTGLDGASIPALLFVPPEASLPAPAVVIIHGGPTWHFQMFWYPVMAHMVSRGWVVLAPNYRGSTGYGRAWQLANVMDIGGVDTRDCVAGVQYLVVSGLTDPERVAVTGRSHGGYLTMTSLTQYPELWAAGSAIVPFLNFFTCHENSREDLQHWDIENMGNPQDNHDLWHARSPYFFLDKVKAPVQFICGENDPRCPPSESIDARNKLLALGREVDYAFYEGEGHAFLKTENIVSSELRRIEFLAKYIECED